MLLRFALSVASTAVHGVHEVHDCTISPRRAIGFRAGAFGGIQTRAGSAAALSICSTTPGNSESRRIRQARGGVGLPSLV